MSLSNNLIVNADDFGLNLSVNKAVLCCFENQIINSTSLLPNTTYFEEAVELIQKKLLLRL